jgi:prefoldin beta subunit
MVSNMSQPNQLSPRLQQQIARYQSLKQQYQVVTQQRLGYESASKETDAAIKELEAAPEDVVAYKNIGGILIRSEKVKLISNLKEQKESADNNVVIYTKKEEQLKKVLDEMGAKLQEELKSAGLGQAA